MLLEGITLAMLKLCKCGKPIPIKESKCDNCTKQPKESDKLYDKYRRNKDTNKFYHSTEWKKVRQQALIRDNYLCQHCMDQNRITSADMIHHIVEVKKDWAKRLDIDNLVSLCNRCHNQIEHFNEK